MISQVVNSYSIDVVATCGFTLCSSTEHKYCCYWSWIASRTWATEPPLPILKGKGNCIAVTETPCHSYGVSLVIMASHSVTCYPT